MLCNSREQEHARRTGGTTHHGRSTCLVCTSLELRVKPQVNEHWSKPHPHCHHTPYVSEHRYYIMINFRVWWSRWVKPTFLALQSNLAWLMPCVLMRHLLDPNGFYSDTGKFQGFLNLTVRKLNEALVLPIMMTFIVCITSDLKQSSCGVVCFQCFRGIRRVISMFLQFL